MTLTPSAQDITPLMQVQSKLEFCLFCCCCSRLTRFLWHLLSFVCMRKADEQKRKPCSQHVAVRLFDYLFRVIFNYMCTAANEGRQSSCQQVSLAKESGLPHSLLRCFAQTALPDLICSCFTCTHMSSSVSQLLPTCRLLLRHHALSLETSRTAVF